RNYFSSPTHTFFLSMVVVRQLTPYPSFFFNDPAPTEIYTLSLHDALPIYRGALRVLDRSDQEGRDLLALVAQGAVAHGLLEVTPDRKSTRLNSSHVAISYAVFCLKKKTSSPSPQLYWPLSDKQVTCVSPNV